MKSPRPKANPKRPPKSSPRPSRNPDSDIMSPKSVYERSIRPMAKGGAVKKAASPSLGRAAKAGREGAEANRRLVDKLSDSRSLQARIDGNNLDERNKLVPPLGTKARVEHDKDPSAGKKKTGGAVKKAAGGMCRGMGAATKGGQYARSK
jgi:hypothetical protein